ncbi:MAG: hypothetical protein ABI348_10995 [Nitrososphaera sp.]
MGAGGYFTSGTTIGSGIENNNQANAATAAGVSSAPANRTFWIDTVHLDGTTNIHGDGKHPPEAFPVNATYPKGGGFVLTPPDKNGTWNFRSFTFSTSQIVVYQGDRVTLNFVGVQGPSHMIEVEGIAMFPLTRGEVHSVTFTADKAGTINYTCHIHMPNMHGEILVLPRPAGNSAT